jgi:hypothetical protein
VQSSRPVEPWLTGSRRDVHPLLVPTLYSYAQARDDLAYWTESLTDAQIWSRPHGLAPVGFHIRHIAGSVERLTTYLKDEPLSTEQLHALQQEMQAGPDREELLRALDDSLQRSEQVILALDPASLEHPRAVGRQRLPTTVAGLLVHLAEHTQRHVGEAIITAKLAQHFLIQG